MRKAVDALEPLSRDPAARRLLDDLERVGEELGRLAGTVARRLLDTGMAPADVSRVTGLSPEVLAEIEASRG